ncbi:MAG: hypothetical protein ACRCYU_01640, partial [Nocardioides sp.]
EVESYPALDWLAQRRDGESAADIAAAEGVSHQLVSLQTRDAGPLLRVRQVRLEAEEWARRRHGGESLRVIAMDVGATRGQVAVAMKPYGPFPTVVPGLPAGLVGITGTARLAGVSQPTVERWRGIGLLPGPDFVTATGRELWFQTTITTWLEQAAILSTCPVCGARCLSVAQHRSHAHRDRGQLGRNSMSIAHCSDARRDRSA